MVTMINRPDHTKWLAPSYPSSTSSNPASSRHHHNHHLPHHHDISMSRERDREYQKQRAREARESMASSSSKEQEQQRVMFDVKKSSNNKKNNFEKILGPYDLFKKLGGDKTSLLGVYQQPPTPIAPREPIHDPDSYPPPIFPPPQPLVSETGSSSSSSSSSKSSQRSLPPPHSSRNGTTRPPKTLPPSAKPPHHPSQHAQPRNGEVKGNLKSGPSSGPGDGNCGKLLPPSSTNIPGKPNLPPLKLGGGGDDGDPFLQKIRSEMSIKDPVSAILQTPRPDHHNTANSPFNNLIPIKDPPASKDASIKGSRRGEDELASKFNKPPDMSAMKNQKLLDGGGVKGDLSLSEESEDDQVGPHDNGQLQSSVVGSSNAKPFLSPISGKTSEDSSSEEDSSDDSEMSSNNTTEDEQPASEPSSPKSQGGDKSPNPWKLDKFIPPRKIKSPSSQETVATGPAVDHPEDDNPVVDKAPAQSQRKRIRRNSKVAPSAGAHRGPRHNHDPVGHSDDSSDEGEPHPRPTPRTLPQLRPQKPQQPARKPDSHQHDSDSDSDSFRPSKSDSNHFAVTSSSSSKDLSKLPDRSRNASESVVSRESTRRTPKKKTDSKKETGAKPDSGKSRRGVKSREYIPCDIDTDSDNSIIDVESTTPVKSTTSQHNTPSRTPKELNINSSPLKARQSSPHVSPMPVHSVSNKSSSKRTPLSESQSSEPLVSSVKEDLFGRNQSNVDKLETVKDKGLLINPAFTLGKDKKERERDPDIKVSSRKSKPHRETKKPGRSSSDRDRSNSERSNGVTESSPLDNRLSGTGSSPFVDKLSESPIVSPEPKVPITQVHHDYGSRKFTCTIPLTLIDKVPKLSVSSIPKSEIKSEVDKKEVLDNRTTGKGGKGKRKTGDPNTKDLCNEDKKTFIISSIFRGVRRPDSETDSEKVKKEPKAEANDSDDSDNEKCVSKSSSNLKVKEEVEETSMARPSSVGHRSVSSSPLPSSTPNTSSSRQHKKRKKDSLPERTPRSPSTHKRLKPRCNSERLAPDYSGVNSVGDTNSLDSCDVHSSGRVTGVESDNGTSRKRERERESSLESTRSSSHSESGDRRSKKSRTSKSKDAKDSSVKSPAVRPGSQRAVDSNSSHSWSQEKDIQQSSYPQRPQHSQQSSQGKVNDCQTTPNTDGGYHHSRPASEHESRLDGASYRSTDQPGSSDRMCDTPASENGAQMIPPQSVKQSASTFGTPSSMVASHPIYDLSAWQAYYANSENKVYPSYFDRKVGPEITTDYMCYMNMAKNLKHTADTEDDRCMQAMKYLEAALYFILSGKAMENDCATEPSASLRIYKDTLSFIRYVASVFMREKNEGSLNNKLAVISLRCQSLLSLKIYIMRRHEHKDIQRQLNNYFNTFSKSGNGDATSNNSNNNNGTANSWNGQRTSGSPSHLSQTPSPAGSVGSEGSQSSGYTTSTESNRSKNGPTQVGHTPPHPHPPASTTVPVPSVIHSLLVRQNQLSSHLATAHDLWMEADNVVYKNNMQDFFIELDRLCSPLTLHSSLTDLVFYAQCGLRRLKE